MKLHIRRIERARDFMALAPAWSELMLASGQTSPFLSYDWFWCCWHGVWPRRRPEILVIEDTSGPLAIIPLMHWRIRLYGLPVRCLSFLEYAHTPLADILSVGEHERVMEGFIDHLTSRADWDITWLQRLPVNSPTVKAIERIPADQLRWRRVENLFSPYLAIKGEWQSFYNGQSLSLRKAHGELQAKLERTGDPSIEEHRSVDPWSPFFHEAVSIIRQGCRWDGRTTKAAVPRLAEFLCELTRRASKNGWLSLWLLRLNGRVIATEYQLRSNGKVQALWVDDDPAYPEHLPGKVLQLNIIQSLFNRGCTYEYSFGPEMQEDRLAWATGTHEMVHVKLYRPGLYARLLDRMERTMAPGAHT